MLFKFSFLRKQIFILFESSKNILISFLGIHVVYDLSRTPGNRVVSLDVLCTQCRVPRYEPLRDDDNYKVVLPNFLANGGDGFQMLRDEVLKHDYGKHMSLFFLSQMHIGSTLVESRGVCGARIAKI